MDEQEELADKIRRFQEGETQLFDWFSEHYFAPLARHFSWDDEAIQLMQIRCWHELEKFWIKPQSVKCFRAIVTRWCRWAFIQHWRRQKPPPEPLENHLDHLQANDIRPDISEEEIYTLIRNSNLSECERWCLEQIPHMTRQQTARALGISLASVNEAIRRGRKKIHDHIAEQEDRCSRRST